MAVGGEEARDVAAELHADTNSHHKVDQGDCIESDVPPVHHGTEVDQNKDDYKEDDGGTWISNPMRRNVTT